MPEFWSILDQIALFFWLVYLVFETFLGLYLLHGRFFGLPPVLVIFIEYRFVDGGQTLSEEEEDLDEEGNEEGKGSSFFVKEEWILL
ncbi:hypothetical protein MMC14_000831 [Varicellaria rhodocarpa]|nr:hypothetical protein [Varicellaria rhodocarpa]